MSTEEKKSIALIELSRGHHECLYAQSLFLQRSGYEVFLVTPAATKNLVEAFDTIKDQFFHRLGKSRLKNIFQFRQIMAWLKEYGIEEIIINTAQGSQCRDFVWWAKKKQLYGVLHGVHRLQQSRTQQWISKYIKKYFVLNDYILHVLPAVEVRRFHVASFYPIFFPPQISAVIEKPDDEFWVCIPGQVEFKRRDYATLLQQIDSNLNPKIKFILLGQAFHAHGDGERLQQGLREKNLLSRFKFFTEYVSGAVFKAYAENSDLVLPLIHPSKDYLQNYLSQQISGSFNIAFAYAKPMLLDKVFSQFDDFRTSSRFYEKTDLQHQLNNCVQQVDELKRLSQSIKAYEKFGLDYQARHYVEHLCSAT
ncbi:MAG: hypothetical protein OEY38_08350 [Gammaproteobacteria bacterium]|nr:hypothetical protein [Gammaproteobacteria bacterium]